MPPTGPDEEAKPMMDPWKRRQGEEPLVVEDRNGEPIYSNDRVQLDGIKAVQSYNGKHGVARSVDPKDES